MDRRGFIQASVGMAGTAAVAQRPIVQNSMPSPVPRRPISSASVSLVGDAAPLSPIEQVQRLARLTMVAHDPVDRYLTGGAVAQLEGNIARLFGKPAAAFFPTGTMANNVAVRLLCGDRRLLLVQRDSHLYADESNAPAILSGLNMVPLAGDRVSPTLSEVTAEIDRWETGFFAEKVGAISLESPVRAHDGAYIPVDDLKAMSALARARRIGLHWDGARALLLFGTPGFSPEAVGSLFDTIMLSLDKYLDAPTGAVLIGEAGLIEQARHLRHVFGGLIDKGWQLALPPLAALPTFKDQYMEARSRAAVILDGLRLLPDCEVRPVVNGTNITLVRLRPSRIPALKARFDAADIRASIAADGLMAFYANTSLLRRPPSEILRVFTA